MPTSSSGLTQLSLDSRANASLALLAGVSSSALDALADLGVRNIGQLSRSAVFEAAWEATFHFPAEAQLARAALREEHRNAANPGELGLAALALLDDARARRLSEALRVETLRELATWPPYIVARAILRDDPSNKVGLGPDPEVPQELVPAFNQYATEKSFYSVYAVDPVESERTADLDQAVDLAQLLVRAAPERPRTGWVLRYEQTWTPVALTLGNLLHSLALAPGESTRVAVVDWSRRQGVRTSEDISQIEALSNSLMQSRSINEITRAVAREAQGGFSAMNSNSTVSNNAYSSFGLQNAEQAFAAAAGGAMAGGAAGVVGGGVAGAGIGAFVGTASGAFAGGLGAIPGWAIGAIAGAGIGAGAGGLIGATGGGVAGFFGAAEFGSGADNGSNTTLDSVTTTSTSGTRDIEAEMAQNIQDRTQQHTSTTRNKRASIVQEVTQEESETISTRVVTNYNHMHALTIQYFEVVQLYRTETRLASKERCLYVPIRPVERWTEALVQTHRAELIRSALSAEAAYALASAENTTLITAPGAATTPAEVRARLGRDHLAEARRKLDTLVSLDPHNAWRLPDSLRLIGVQLRAVAASAGKLPISLKSLEARFVVRLRSGQSKTIASLLEPVDLRLEDIEAIDLEMSRAVLDLDEQTETAVAKHICVLLAFRREDASAPESEDDSLAFELVFPAQFVAESEERLSVRCADFTRSRSMAQLVRHLNENSAHYSRGLVRRRNSPLLAALLARYSWNGVSLLNAVDPDPIAVSGNNLVFRLLDEGRRPTTVAKGASSGPRVGDVRQSDIVPVPTGGVFAEAVQGRANAAERLDLTRFWNWQDSPIPIVPPEIAPLQAGSRAMAVDLRPGSLDPALAANMTPAALPAPTGLGAALSTLSSQMFRDMSGIAQTAALAQASLEQAMQGATATGAQASEGLAQGLAMTKELAGKIVDMNSSFATTLLQSGMGAMSGVMGGGAPTGLGGAPGGAKPNASNSNPSVLGALIGAAKSVTGGKAPALSTPTVPANGANGASGVSGTTAPHATPLEERFGYAVPVEGDESTLQLDMLRSFSGVGPSSPSSALPPAGGAAGRGDAQSELDQLIATRLTPLVAVAHESDANFDRAASATLTMAADAERSGLDSSAVYAAALPNLQPAWLSSVDRAVASFNSGDPHAIARVESMLGLAQRWPDIAGPVTAGDVLGRLELELQLEVTPSAALVSGGESVSFAVRVLQSAPGGSGASPLANARVRLWSPASVEEDREATTDADGRATLTLTKGVSSPYSSGVDRFAGQHDLTVYATALSPLSNLVHVTRELTVRGAVRIDLVGAIYDDNGDNALSGSVVLVPAARAVNLEFRATKGGQPLQQHTVTGVSLNGAGTLEAPTRTDARGRFNVLYLPAAGAQGVAYASAHILAPDGVEGAGMASLSLS